MARESPWVDVRACVWNTTQTFHVGFVIKGTVDRNPKSRRLKERVFAQSSGNVNKCYVRIIDLLDTTMISVTVSLVDDPDRT